MARKRSNRQRTRHVPRNLVQPGAPPGTLQPRPDAAATRIHVSGFGPEGYDEQTIEDPASLDAFMGRWPTTWINVAGLADSDTLRAVGERFGIHPLALEDVVNLGQRPKVEEYGDQLFVVVRMGSLDDRLETDQLSLILGPTFVLTFQERLGDCLDPVRERLRAGRGRIRTAGADYLSYAILDAVIDHYFPILERYGEHLEGLEERVFGSPGHDLISEIHQFKREFLLLRRSVWPLRETLVALQREGTPCIQPETQVYLRDCYDHVIQLMDVIEVYRDTASGLMEAYLSSVSFRSNEVMKVLTIVGAIFIPLTFIAGIYGMNFNPEASPWNMPELDWVAGYPACLALMTVTAAGLLLFFRRKGWIGSKVRAVTGRGGLPGTDRTPT